ncbi:unnamed protein product [Porites lobata]|uniref:C2H2-type domain-containing protein n=1 Tax=Porites lobata TaxID=104759 RepID=A0ABN8PC28_9CNID|nr:unnamed protein product [Porites lobata]
MAFITNVREFQALLDGCSSTHDWELLLESILIPDEWIPMAYARLSELAAQEIPTEINQDTGSDEVNDLLSDSFTTEEMQAVNEMERMALHKNNNESAPLSPQDTRDNIFDEWTGETSELPTWNPSETTFSRSGNLKIHVRTHTGKKPYECNRCDKKFADKSALNRHLKAHDKQAAERTFTCATCGENFHNHAPYNVHIRTAHQQPAAATRKRPAAKNTDAPAAKKHKKSADPGTSPTTPQTSSPGSSWQKDPVLIPSNLIPAAEENITDTYRQHWPQIRTRFSRRNRLQDWYNFRLSSISPASLREQLNRIFADQPTVFKINFSFGFILRNTETGALQYHHPSANNHLVLEQPFLISSPDDLERLYQQIAEIDFLE